MHGRRPLPGPQRRSAQPRDKLPLVAQASHPELISRRSYHTCWPTVPLSAQRPTPEHILRVCPARRTEPRLGSGYLGLSGSAALPLRTGLLGQSFAPALGFPTCGPIHPTRTDLARMTALLG